MQFLQNIYSTYVRTYGHLADEDVDKYAFHKKYLLQNFIFLEMTISTDMLCMKFTIDIANVWLSDIIFF